MSLLVATDLHKAFGPTPALDGAGISVRSGEIVAIMGPSRVKADQNVLEFTVRGAAAERFDEVARAVAQSKGVTSVEPSRTFLIEGRDGNGLAVLVASCAELRRFARVGTCTDGDAFAPIDEENPNRPNHGERVSTLLDYGKDPAKGPSGPCRHSSRRPATASCSRPARCTGSRLSTRRAS
jgi:hypothetical protein